MKKIQPDEVRKVAKLARLQLSEDKLKSHTFQLEKILAYVEQLENVDTTGVEPTTRAVEVTNVVREDEVIALDDYEDIINLAPEIEGEFYKVPKII